MQDTDKSKVAQLQLSQCDPIIPGVVRQEHTVVILMTVREQHAVDR